MKRNILIALIVFSVATVFIPSAFAFSIYKKPAFNGRVIDAESKKPIEPIEGAIVVADYNKSVIRGPGGPGTTSVKIDETLTDANGDFHFPAYIAVIGPLSRVDEVSFIIYKPGYWSLKYVDGTRIPDEKYFAIQEDMIGTEGEIQCAKRFSVDDEIITWKGLMGMVKLKRANTREERLRAMPSPPGGFTSQGLPILIKIINEERKNLGLERDRKGI